MQATWRVFYAMILASGPGAAMGWRLQPIGETLMDCWYGGALSMPIGFMLGLFWQSRAAPRSIASNVRAILVYGGFSLALAVFALLTRDMWVRALAAA